MAPARSSSVDVAKGLGIALVVFGHNRIVLRGGDDGLLFGLIFAFHVPLFFFLAGLFVRPADALPGFVRAKADSLLKPYFVVLVGLGIVLAAGQWRQGGLSAAWLLGYVAGVLHGGGGSIEWTPLWFLPCLFLVSVLGLLLLKLARSPLAIGLVALASLGLGLALLGQVPPQPWSADLAPICLAFFLLGHGGRERVVNMRFSLPGLALLGLAFALLNWPPAPHVDLNLRVLQAPWLAVPRALVGIGLCLQLACLLGRWPAAAASLASIGSGSLFILLFHGIVQGKVAHTAGRLIGNVVAGDLLGFAAGIALPLLLLQLVARVPLLARLLLPLPKRRALNAER
ncbi:MAG: acyltransferase family protein [Burkholderiaceae bacterium]